MEPKFLSKKRIFEKSTASTSDKNSEQYFHPKTEESPNFLLKLYKILETPEYSDIIHWNDTGDYFVVKNLHDFTETILPKFYKHNNFSSFVRQLNMYDFHKKKSVQNEHIFQHKSFLRGKKDLVQTIKRKNKKEPNLNNAVGFPDLPNNNFNMNSNDKAVVEYFKNPQQKKPTKNSLDSALKFLIKSVKASNEKQKILEEKIDNLGKQNEDFLMQNQQMLQEIVAKSDYNNKLEAVVYFILEIIMNKSKTGTIKNCGDLKNVLIARENCNDSFTNPQIEADPNNTSKFTQIIPFNEVKCNDHSNQVDNFQSFLDNFINRAGIKPNSTTIKPGLALPLLGAGKDEMYGPKKNYVANELLPPSPTNSNKSDLLQNFQTNKFKTNPLDLSPQLSPIRFKRSRNQSFDEILNNNDGKKYNNCLAHKDRIDFPIKEENNVINSSNIISEEFNNFNNLNNNENNQEKEENENSINENSFSLPSRNLFDLEFNCGCSDRNDNNNSMLNGNLEDISLDGLNGYNRKSTDKYFFDCNNSM